jgi:DNA-binding NarL/FixJ family response regulator
VRIDTLLGRPSLNHLPTDLTAVVLDPHPLWLDAVERVLDRIGVEVRAKTTTPEEAFGLVRVHEPSIFVTELASPGERIGGLACVQRVHDTLPGVRIVVLSAFDDPHTIQAALAAGAAAYVVKTAHPEDLATAVRQAFESSIYFLDTKLGRRSLLREAGGGSSVLTKREVEILRLTAQGHSNGDLAKMLWVTEQTVKFHLSNIYKKLGVANRTEASHWAQVNGLLEATGPPDAWSRATLAGAGSA